MDEDEPADSLSLRGSLPLLWVYLRPLWRRVAILAVTILANIASELAPALLLARFIDQAVSGASVESLQLIAVAFLLVAIARQAVLSVMVYMSEDVAWRATNELRFDMLRHTLGLDSAFHGRHSPGELIERVDRDVTMLAEFFSNFILDVVGRVLLAAGMVFITWLVDWRIGLLVGAWGIVSFFALRRLRGISIANHVALRAAYARISSLVADFVTSTEDLRSSGAEQYAMEQLDIPLEDARGQLKRSRVRGRYFSGALEIIFGFAAASVLLLGARLLGEDAISFGEVYLGFSYVMLLSLNLTLLTRQLNQVQVAIAAVGRIQELFRARPAVADGGQLILASRAPSIEFRSVSYEYSGGSLALRDVSFRLEPGETLGLVGRSGSGKTTLSRLAARLLDVTSGSVCVDGFDLRDVRSASLRREVAVVTQDVQLFEATVRDNISFFSTDVSDDVIERAIANLGLDLWYAALPDGLDTIIRPTTMSAGEAQLLAFTRVLLSDPSIVILDEASSLLDKETERLFGESVSRLLDGRTAIVIAHRLGAVASVDKILVLGDGTVAEFGQRSDLLNDRDSVYRALLGGSRR